MNPNCLDSFPVLIALLAAALVGFVAEFERRLPRVEVSVASAQPADAMVP